jgi:hypothetical protein
VLADAPDEQLPPGVDERAVLERVDRDQRLVVDGEARMVADEELEFLVRVVEHVRRLDRDLVHGVRQQRREDLVLSGEVVVERAAGDPDGLADLVHADAVKAPLTKETGRRVEDLRRAFHADQDSRNG